MRGDTRQGWREARRAKQRKGQLRVYNKKKAQKDCIPKRRKPTLIHTPPHLLSWNNNNKKREGTRAVLDTSRAGINSSKKGWRGH